VGISSGANFLGALKVQSDYGRQAVVVSVFPDDNKKYLSTDLVREEPVRDGFLSPDVTLTGFGALKRVCLTCCEPADCVMAGQEGGTVEDADRPPCPWWRGDPGPRPGL
jgi:cysteine synthase A